MLLAFLGDRQITEVVEDLHERPNAVRELASSPGDYFQNRSIPLPEGVTLDVSEDGSSDRVTAQVAYRDWSITVGWDRGKGFFATTPSGPAASMSARFMSSVEEVTEPGID
jgi:hypothetical protein